MEFQNGKIYTIRSSMTEKFYIGSTNQKTLAQRLCKHRNSYKLYLKDNTKGYMTSFEILQYDDHYIELLELCPCNTKDELHQREGQLQRQFKNEMVNKVISRRTVKERYKDNKEQLALKAKAYNDSHREQNAITHKAYRELNKEKIALNAKDYRESHKKQDKISRELHREEKKAYDKAYHELHKEENKTANKARYESNKEEIAIKAKVFRELNKERLAIKHKEYRESHKEQISAKKKAQYQAKKLLA